MGGTVSKITRENADPEEERRGDVNFEAQIDKIYRYCVELVENFFVEMRFLPLTNLIGSYICHIVKLLKECFQMFRLTIKPLCLWTKLRTEAAAADYEMPEMARLEFINEMRLTSRLCLEVSKKMQRTVLQTFKIAEKVEIQAKRNYVMQLETLVGAHGVFTDFVCDLIRLVNDSMQFKELALCIGTKPKEVKLKSGDATQVVEFYRDCVLIIPPKTMMKGLITAVEGFGADILRAKCEYRKQFGFFYSLSWFYY